MDELASGDAAPAALDVLDGRDHRQRAKLISSGAGSRSPARDAGGGEPSAPHRGPNISKPVMRPPCRWKRKRSARPPGQESTLAVTEGRAPDGRRHCISLA